MSKNHQCVNCGSEKVVGVGVADKKRPNGDMMAKYHCLDCKCNWEE